jgi:hypothetical protein
MKVWKLVLVSALAVLAFVMPAPPVQSDWPDDCYTNDCRAPGSDCQALCECLGFNSGIYVFSGSLPGSCLCFF